MRSRRNLLKRSRLYLILDKPGFDIEAGVFGIVQLRDKISAKPDILKAALKLSRRLRRSNTLFIVNDHPDLAVFSGADGVHLGQEDMPLEKAKGILGKDKIIGISCHNLVQALKAQKQGADYIGIGPVFATPTKPGIRPIGLKVLKELKGKIKIPYFAIGGINKNNIAKIISFGCRRVAVRRSAAEAKELFKELKTK
ncbi:MAG: thiamine phosphate synthase [Candidatus Omnitrophica bacterium]|nr:thiamine phosphate synthase [Candidatus Omnitrophota bacterium]